MRRKQNFIPGPLRLTACLLFMTASSSVISCKTRIAPQSTTEGLALEPSSPHNVALLTTGSDEAGRRRNVDVMTEALELPHMGFHSSPALNKSHAEILDATRAAASSVKGNGTLLWYINSHGSTDGTITTRDGKRLTMAQALNTMKESRSHLAEGSASPLPRLIVIVDSCHSGVQVPVFRLNDQPDGGNEFLSPFEHTDGLFRRISRPPARTAAANPIALERYDGSGVFANGLVITSASALQTSSRNALSTAFRAAAIAAQSKPEINVGEFLLDLQRRVAAYGQSLQYRSFPDDGILEEPLHHPTTSTHPANNGT